MIYDLSPPIILLDGVSNHFEFLELVADVFGTNIAQKIPPCFIHLRQTSKSVGQPVLIIATSSVLGDDKWTATLS